MVLVLSPVIYVVFTVCCWLDCDFVEWKLPDEKVVEITKEKKEEGKSERRIKTYILFHAGTFRHLDIVDDVYNNPENWEDNEESGGEGLGECDEKK